MHAHIIIVLLTLTYLTYILLSFIIIFLKSSSAEFARLKLCCNEITFPGVWCAYTKNNNNNTSDAARWTRKKNREMQIERPWNTFACTTQLAWTSLSIWANWRMLCLPDALLIFSHWQPFIRITMQKKKKNWMQFCQYHSMGD